MTHADDQAIVADYLAGDILAGAAIVKAHERIIRHLARRHESPRCEAEDLMQVGRMALLREAHKYDSTRASFVTFAYRVVNKAQYIYARKGRSVVSISEDPSANGVCPVVVWLDEPFFIEDVGGRECVPKIDTFAAPSADVDSYIDAAMMLRPLNRSARNIVVRNVCNEEEFSSIGPTLGMAADTASKIKQRAVEAMRAAGRRTKARARGDARKSRHELRQ